MGFLGLQLHLVMFVKFLWILFVTMTQNYAYKLGSVAYCGFFFVAFLLCSSEISESHSETSIRTEPAPQTHLSGSDLFPSLCFIYDRLTNATNHVNKNSYKLQFVSFL